MSDKHMTVAELSLALSHMPADAEVQIAVWRYTPEGGRGLLHIPIESVDLRSDNEVTVTAHEQKEKAGDP